MKNPFETLGLDDAASPEEVKARWRSLASEHHPDNGGDPVRFDECRKAYEEAARLAAEPKPCQPCGGAGKVSVNRGFSSVKVTCSACGGSGQA